MKRRKGERKGGANECLTPIIEIVYCCIFCISYLVFNCRQLKKKIKFIKINIYSQNVVQEYYHWCFDGYYLWINLLKSNITCFNHIGFGFNEFLSFSNITASQLNTDRQRQKVTEKLKLLHWRETWVIVQFQNMPSFC